MIGYETETGTGVDGKTDRQKDRRKGKTTAIRTEAEMEARKLIQGWTRRRVNGRRRSGGGRGGGEGGHFLLCVAWHAAKKGE